jgi:beta-galactosidase
VNRLRAILTVCFASACIVNAAPLTATIQTPPPAESGYFKLGTNKNPAGHAISVNSRSLLFDGQPWFPIMGEFHYSRVPENEWRDELLKMKAGGIDIVSTYVFWIHHEEIEGQWDWSGRRNLRKFVQTCNEIGLKVIVRCGPWCHGEVRNGGFPDWVVAHKDWKLRSTDTNFLAAVKILYGQIAEQLRGELWKDGGPVIGIQVDNEYRGSPAYLLALKKIAIESGLDVPLYTKTGWPAMTSPMPPGELLPLFGTYAEGFWDRTLTPMDGINWTHFVFSKLRTDNAIASDIFGNRVARDETNTEKYPHLTCEVGGGMETSYHRRILVDPRDVEAVALVQLGDGSSSLGYYMFHGGQNPGGKLTTLQESQATGYANDMPEKNYDFQAPLGEYGQIRPQYYWMRRLHLFLHDFGSSLAQMPTSLPDLRPTNKTDLATLRWAVRSDGNSGFIFVNNYQRLQPMPPKRGVQFKLNLPGGELIFPSRPVTIPADEFFFWPFNFDLGGAKLIYATAQPICRIDDGGTQMFFFAQTPGVKSEFVFDPATLAESSQTAFRNVKPGRDAAIKLKTKSGAQIRIVLLSDTDSLALVKKTENGIERAVFEKKPKTASLKVKTQLLQPAGTLRTISLSGGKSHIAIAPTEADWTNAAVWKIQLPKNPDLKSNPLLRIHYVGDVARITLNGKLIDDNFYNGRTFDLGLNRYAPEILAGDLRMEILPLQKDAPIFIEDKAKPDFGKADSVAKIQNAEIVNCCETVADSPDSQISKQP